MGTLKDRIARLEAGTGGPPLPRFEVWVPVEGGSVQSQATGEVLTVAQFWAPKPGVFPFSIAIDRQGAGGDGDV